MRDNILIQDLQAATPIRLATDWLGSDAYWRCNFRSILCFDPSFVSIFKSRGSFAATSWSEIFAVVMNEGKCCFGSSGSSNLRWGHSNNMRLRILTHVGVFKLDLNAHFLEKIGRTYSGQFKHLGPLKSSAWENYIFRCPRKIFVWKIRNTTSKVVLLR